MSDTDSELDVNVGWHTHISEIHGLDFHIDGDPEVLRLANKWFVKVAALNRHMDQHWTVPEKASLVALLQRFKQCLSELLSNVISDSEYEPVHRRLTDHDRNRVIALFVSGSKFAKVFDLEWADIHT